MAISRQDCLLLLTDIQHNNGLDISKYVSELYKSNTPSIDVIKFINDNRQLDVQKFYEKIRHSYNQKHSKLYGNIVKEIEDGQKTLTTLSAMLTQLLLFTENVTDINMFYQHSRANEITKVLHNYFKTGDMVPCVKLLRLIKSDIKALESIK